MELLSNEVYPNLLAQSLRFAVSEGAEGEAVGGRRGGRAGERAVCGASGLQ